VNRPAGEIVEAANSEKVPPESPSIPKLGKGWRSWRSCWELLKQLEDAVGACGVLRASLQERLIEGSFLAVLTFLP